MFNIVNFLVESQRGAFLEGTQHWVEHRPDKPGVPPIYSSSFNPTWQRSSGNGWTCLSLELTDGGFFLVLTAQICSTPRRQRILSWDVHSTDMDHQGAGHPGRAQVYLSWHRMITAVQIQNNAREPTPCLGASRFWTGGSQRARRDRIKWCSLSILTWHEDSSAGLRPIGGGGASTCIKCLSLAGSTSTKWLQI